MAQEGSGRYEGLPVGSRTIRVYADIATTDVIKDGSPVCWKIDSGTAAERYKYVAKPSLNNIEDFAGIVSGPGRTGPGWIDITQFDGAIMRGVTVQTDENITSGDLLAPIPETFYFGRATATRPVFRATETVDRSTTAGTVTGEFGHILVSDGEMQRKIVRFFDHFTGQNPASATADAAPWLLTGTGATLTFTDALAPAEQTDATKNGAGIATLAGATTGWEANLQQNGEPYSVGARQSLFFRARIGVASAGLGSAKYYFAGFNMAGTTDMGDACGTDAMGFRINNTTLDFIYGKNQTSSAIQTATGFTSATIASPAVAADTFIEVAFLVRNKAAATTAKELTIWVNGTKIVHTVTGSNIVDDESLTLAFLAEHASAATALLIDRVEVANYIG